MKATNQKPNKKDLVFLVISPILFFLSRQRFWLFLSCSKYCTAVPPPDISPPSLPLPSTAFSFTPPYFFSPTTLSSPSPQWHTLWFLSLILRALRASFLSLLILEDSCRVRGCMSLPPSSSCSSASFTPAKVWSRTCSLVGTRTLSLFYLLYTIYKLNCFISLMNDPLFSIKDNVHAKFKIPVFLKKYLMHVRGSLLLITVLSALCTLTHLILSPVI